MPGIARSAVRGKGRAPVAAGLGLALLAGSCAGPGVDGVTPVSVDARRAAASTSAYRASEGRGPVRANARLNRLAARQAAAMAGRGRLGHGLIGPLEERLRDGSYVWLVAAENVGAGYDTYEAALSAWQTSPGHRSNLLEAQVTEIGVGAARADDRYGTYWALILAAPDSRRGG